MNVSALVWIVTLAVTVVFFVWEFFSHVRRPHEPSIGESARWSAFYIGLALLFGVGVGVVSGWEYGGQYFAGYLTEKALSVDNLFVFLLVMTSFAVPKAYQQKVLLIGIVIALIMRGAFIAVGAALIANFSWIFYLFGALLLVLAAQQLRGSHGGNAADNAVVRLARRVLPVTDEYHGDRLTVRLDGRRLVTPMFLTVVAVGVIDLVFAVDSIPAIYGLTEEAYLVFTANAFALMGLRQLYFLLGGLMERLVFLSQGLAVILGFIGVKLLLHALHVNEVPFINGGEPLLWVPEIPTWLSLVVIAATVAVATVASLAVTRGRSSGVSGVSGHSAAAHADAAVADGRHSDVAVTNQGGTAASDTAHADRGRSDAETP
ncbi:TerC/Alx family metal homeostasis membrane protein [Naasia sp. SYSU D00057]|uniref:TerC/Alx family metal homeostasis membrane protein n=1 Tax=Naasia sp. SYSU D00057 TaxID=2817380 RepID=UPI001B315131|nr:TerC/Alx family metal homeostasis membrane protein [Naasia sp. SYSU D00057]